MGRALCKQTPANKGCKSIAMGLPPAPSTSAEIPSMPGAVTSRRTQNEVKHLIDSGRHNSLARFAVFSTLLCTSRQLSTRDVLSLESSLILTSPLFSRIHLVFSPTDHCPACRKGGALYLGLTQGFRSLYTSSTLPLSAASAARSKFSRRYVPFCLSEQQL